MTAFLTVSFIDSVYKIFITARIFLFRLLLGTFILLLFFPFFYNFFNSSLITEQISQLISLQLEKPLIILVIANSNLANIPVKPIFFNIKNPKLLPILDHPDIISLLGRLTSPIDGVNLDILIVLGFPRMDHDYYVDIVGCGHSSKS